MALTPDGKSAFVTNLGDNTVSVIDTETDSVITTVSVGSYPRGLAVTPDGSRAYVANSSDNTISVINTSSNSVVTTISGVSGPLAVAVSPDGKRAYVSTWSQSVAVLDIDPASDSYNSVVATIAVDPGDGDGGIDVSPDGSHVYVAAGPSGYMSVIDTTTNTVTTTIAVGPEPFGVAVSPDGTRLYVTIVNVGQGIYPPTTPVSVIDTASNTVMATVTVPGVQRVWQSAPTAATRTWPASPATVCPLLIRPRIPLSARRFKLALYFRDRGQPGRDPRYVPVTSYSPGKHRS